MEEDSSYLEINPADVCQLPISQMANDANDDGVPLSISRPEGASNELEAFGKLSKVVARELFRMPYRAGDTEVMVTFEDGSEKFELTSIQLSLDKGKLMVRAFSEGGALMKTVDSDDLRKRDPKTGSFLVAEDDSADTSPKDEMITVYKAGSDDSPSEVVTVTPDQVERKAKVGYEVTWSDGSKFIYSHKAIAKAAGGSIR